MKRVAVKRKNLDRARLGIDEPAFPNTGMGVRRPFGEQIFAAVRRAEHLGEKIGRSLNSAPCQASRLTRKEDQNVWLYGVGAFKEDVVGCRESAATKPRHKWNQHGDEAGDHRRMRPGRRGHLVQLSLDNFIAPAVFRKRKQILVSPASSRFPLRHFTVLQKPAAV